MNFTHEFHGIYYIFSENGFIYFGNQSNYQLNKIDNAQHENKT